jgi:hypothetical protein
MRTLHSRKGDNHPHLSQASAVHTDTGEIAERSPSKVVHLPAGVPSQHQV